MPHHSQATRPSKNQAPWIRLQYRTPETPEPCQGYNMPATRRKAANKLCHKQKAKKQNPTSK